VVTAGCASWFTKGEPPEVLVTNITPLEATPFEQQLQVDLRIRNPNDFDLIVTGIDFKLNMNGKRLARGLGSKEVTVPRLGDAVVSVKTSTSTFDVIRQLLDFSQKQELAYDIGGTLHLKDGRLPFDNTGTLLEKGWFSGPSPAQNNLEPSPEPRETGSRP
jgi:LEA14-like dessication related protein